MTEIPAENYSPQWAGSDRREPPLLGDERATLTGFLDWNRRTFELKCSGIDVREMSKKSIPPSGLSLHGLIRHLAAIERWSFRIQFAAESVPLLYYSDDDPNQDFDALDGDVVEAMAVWRAECERSRGIVAAASSLEQTGTRRRDGQPFTLRWMLIHTIEEYARHNGHADLLRECIDGRVGM